MSIIKLKNVTLFNFFLCECKDVFNDWPCVQYLTLGWILWSRSQAFMHWGPVWTISRSEAPLPHLAQPISCLHLNGSLCILIGHDDRLWWVIKFIKPEASKPAAHSKDRQTGRREGLVFKLLFSQRLLNCHYLFFWFSSAAAENKRFRTQTDNDRRWASSWTYTSMYNIFTQIQARKIHLESKL